MSDPAPPAPWPAAVDAHLRTRHGPPVAVDPLGGMSGARVYRVRFASTSLIAKATDRPAEVRFYERIAETLRGRGVPVPNLERAFATDGGHWLLIEDIPRALPPERWPADPAALAVLARLHATTWDRPLPLPGGFVPGWTEETTAAALSCFPKAVARDVGPLLKRLRRDGVHLLRPRCSISGDPNPTNWGMREGGDVVLFDWERFGAGHPALDLAITVPGLGDDAAFRATAAGYRRAWDAVGIGSKPGPAFDRLARDVALAKVWNVVEFFAGAVGGGAAARSVVRRLIPAIPGWMAGLT